MSFAGLFAGVPLCTLEDLVAASSACTFSKGQIALHQGTRSGEVHLVISGAFKASSITTSGSSVTLSIMGPSEVFGEMAFLDGGKHSASVTALTQSLTLRMSATVLGAVAAAHPSVNDHLSKQLATRLRRLSSASEHMASEAVAPRLARQLLDLSQRFGVVEAEGTRIALDLSQQELAELVAATRERVNRVLAQWARQGVTSYRGRQVIVHSGLQLALFAGVSEEQAAPSQSD